MTCKAGSHICRAHGEVSDSCHATRPCGSGLTCDAWFRVCRGKGELYDRCHGTRPCKSGFSCACTLVRR